MYGLAIHEFQEWYNNHNHKTVVKTSDDYGSSVSRLKYLGTNSYELELGTYSPTNIVSFSKDGKQVEYQDLNESNFRNIRRNSSSTSNSFSLSEGQYAIGSSITGDDISVGFLFNLYDNFITGSDRILTIDVPPNSSSTKLKFECEWCPFVGDGLSLPSDMIVQVEVNEDNICKEDEIRTKVGLEEQYCDKKIPISSTNGS